MDIRIDIGGKKPIYRQLLEQIENDIREGRLLPGSLLPSMNELADSLDISRETVKKTYGILRDRGFVGPQQGKGFYVGNGRVKDGEFFPCLFWEWGYNPRKRRVGKRVFLEDDDLIGE